MPNETIYHQTRNEIICEIALQHHTHTHYRCRVWGAKVAAHKKHVAIPMEKTEPTFTTVSKMYNNAIIYLYRLYCKYVYFDCCESNRIGMESATALRSPNKRVLFPLSLGHKDDAYDSP